MKTFRCPQCGKGYMQLEIVPRHATRIRGMPIEVPDARILRCSECGETSVEANELRRWEELQRTALQDTSSLPTVEGVKSIRKRLRLSVSDFAAVLGVTRQTVHSWERPDSKCAQLGPATLLLKLLQNELDRSGAEVFRELLKLARQRGQRITLAATKEHSVPPPRLHQRLDMLRLRPDGVPSFACQLGSSSVPVRV